MRPLIIPISRDYLQTLSVGGSKHRLFSLDFISYKIFTVNTWFKHLKWPPIPVQSFILSWLEPRIHFMLSCFHQICKPRLTNWPAVWVTWVRRGGDSDDDTAIMDWDGDIMIPAQPIRGPQNNKVDQSMSNNLLCLYSQWLATFSQWNRRSLLNGLYCYSSPFKADGKHKKTLNNVSSLARDCFQFACHGH